MTFRYLIQPLRLAFYAARLWRLVNAPRLLGRATAYLRHRRLILFWGVAILAFAVPWGWHLREGVEPVLAATSSSMPSRGGSDAVGLGEPGNGPGLRVASWNIQHLGWDNDKDYGAVAQVAKRYHFLAIQEVMSAEGIERLQAKLERRTGDDWGVMYSHPIGRGSYQEKYAFLWQEARVDYLDGAAVYIDATDRYAREPYSARFEAVEGGFTFAAATVHILFGDGVADRTPEIRALAGYWEWLQEVYPEEADRILLMGDFNLEPDHAAWEPLREHAQPLIAEGATTVSPADGQYASLYDNIWVGHDTELRPQEAAIDRFPQSYGIDHETVRDRLSDHVPVWVRLE